MAFSTSTNHPHKFSGTSKACQANGRTTKRIVNFLHCEDINLPDWVGLPIARVPKDLSTLDCRPPQTPEFKTTKPQSRYPKTKERKPIQHPRNQFRAQWPQSLVGGAGHGIPRLPCSYEAGSKAQGSGLSKVAQHIDFRTVRKDSGLSRLTLPKTTRRLWAPDKCAPNEETAQTGDPFPEQCRITQLSYEKHA